MVDSDYVLRYFTITSPQFLLNFITFRYNQYKQYINFPPLCGKTGGKINNNCWFFAGNRSGSFQVTVINIVPETKGLITVIFTITIALKDISPEITPIYILHLNYPNPFNPTTTIKFSIPQNSKVIMKVYDLLGREVTTLINEEKQPGNYEVTFNGSGLASGVYYYILMA